MNYRAPLAIAAVAGITFGGAIRADAPHGLLNATPGTSFSYKLEFDGSFWDGQRVAFSRLATVRVGENKAVHLVSSGKLASDDAAIDGTLTAEGTIDAKNAGNRIGSFNVVASLLNNAPATLHQGVTWKAAVPIETGANGEVGYLPVTLNVVSDDGGTPIVNGTGSQTLTASYSGYTVPVDVTARFALRLTASGFDRCDFAGTELVKAGSQSQTMRWSWNMARVAAQRS